MRLESNIDIRIVEGPSLDGVPFPAEVSDPVRLTNPEEFRDLLGAQKVAQKILPCIDTRAAHWRYYLFGARTKRGRLLTPGNRLLSILRQTESRAGIGRRQFPRFNEDGRRSTAQFVKTISSSFHTAYGSALENFWSNDPNPPSDKLCSAAEEYIKAEEYGNFFENSPTRLRYMFYTRLASFRPGLADLICRKGFDLVRAAEAAAHATKLDDEDRLLFFSWSVLQAFYRLPEEGGNSGQNQADEQAETEDENLDDGYYRTLAKAALDLMEKLENPGDLNPKQVKTIRNRLRTALQQKGDYQPPVLTWTLKNDGTRRRVFASLRLGAFARLLRATGGRGE